MSQTFLFSEEKTIKKGLDDFLKLWFTRNHSVNLEWSKCIKKFRREGIQCILATNQEKYRFQYMLDVLGFRDMLDGSYSSALIGYKKPSSEFFSKIFKDLKNIKKEEILFWDDRTKNVEGVKGLGINAELFVSLDDFKEKMKRYGINF